MFPRGNITSKSVDELLTIEFDKNGGDLNRKLRAIFATVGRLKSEKVELPPFVPEPGPHSFREERVDIKYVHLKQLIPAVSEPGAGGIVNVDEPARAIDPVGTVRGDINGSFDEVKVFFCFFLLCNVLNNSDKPLRLPGLVAHQGDRQIDPDEIAVFAQIALFH